jgi:5-hydroxyisourate hydrolase
MPGITVHVVDVTRGLPAVGMRVAVEAGDGPLRRRVGGGAVGESGNVEDPVLAAGDDLAPGPVEVTLATGDYYRGIGAIGPGPAFQETVVYRFQLLDPAEHVHLPIKLSPWGLSVWRGR